MQAIVPMHMIRRRMTMLMHRMLEDASLYVVIRMPAGSAERLSKMTTLDLLTFRTLLMSLRREHTCALMFSKDATVKLYNPLMLEQQHSVSECCQAETHQARSPVLLTKPTTTVIKPTATISKPTFSIYTGAALIVYAASYLSTTMRSQGDHPDLCSNAAS